MHPALKKTWISSTRELNAKRASWLLICGIVIYGQVRGNPQACREKALGAAEFPVRYPSQFDTMTFHHDGHTQDRDSQFPMHR